MLQFIQNQQKRLYLKFKFDFLAPVVIMYFELNNLQCGLVGYQFGTTDTFKKFEIVFH